MDSDANEAIRSRILDYFETTFRREPEENDTQLESNSKSTNSRRLHNLLISGEQY